MSAMMMLLKRLEATKRASRSRHGSGRSLLLFRAPVRMKVSLEAASLAFRCTGILAQMHAQFDLQRQLYIMCIYLYMCI